MTNQQKIIQKSISKGHATNLIAVGVPSFKQQIIGRQDEIASLICHLKELGESPEKGFLLVNGPAGVGKSFLVANLLNDAAARVKLANECHLSVAIWLNCAKFRGPKFVESEFLDRIAVMARQAAGEHPPPGVFSSLPAIVHLFERQKRRRLIFILNNITKETAKILDIMAKAKSRCLAISDEDDLTKDKFREPIFQVKPLSDDMLMSGFFDVDLKINLGAAKMGELIRKCQGLPLIANLANSRFKIEHVDNCRSIADQLIKLGDNNLTASVMFADVVKKMTEIQLTRFASFLFYGIDEPVSPIDLAILSAVSMETAEAQCREFEAMCLINRIDPEPGEKMDRFILHPSLRTAGLSDTNNSKIKSLLENKQVLSGGALLLALKLGIVNQNDEKIDSERSLLKLIQTVIGQERVCLWEKLVRNSVIVHIIYDRYPETVRMQDRQSRTALMIAASKTGSIETVKFIYERYHDAVKVTDKKFGRLPLAWAVANSNAPLEVVEFLFEKYPDAVKTRDALHGQLPLSLAVDYGRLDVARFLCEKFVKAVQIEDAAGRVPLSVAAQTGRLDLVKFLFEKNREVVESTTPLRLAAEYGHLSVVRFLQTQYPQAATVADEEGLLPSDRAAMNGHEDVVEFLLTL